MASTSKTETKVDAGNKKKTFRPYAKKQDEKAATKLPILKYGKGNNFVKFKAALSEVALEEYGDLGRIDQAGELLRTDVYGPGLHRYGPDSG